MVQVPEDVTRFDSIKKGDKIDLDYYEAVALSLKKPVKGETPSANEAIVAERAPGKLPGGGMARTITATATVTKVDVAANKVSIKAPDGKMDTINVSDPALQPELSKLKKGDRVQASYTEAMAITVSPKNKE
jgi:Cu/Ag efflux protein CusF